MYSLQSFFWKISWFEVFFPHLLARNGYKKSYKIYIGSIYKLHQNVGLVVERLGGVYTLYIPPTAPLPTLNLYPYYLNNNCFFIKQY